MILEQGEIADEDALAGLANEKADEWEEKLQTIDTKVEDKTNQNQCRSTQIIRNILLNFTFSSVSKYSQWIIPIKSNHFYRIFESIQEDVLVVNHTHATNTINGWILIRKHLGYRK